MDHRHDLHRRNRDWPSPGGMAGRYVWLPDHAGCFRQYLYFSHLHRLVLAKSPEATEAGKSERLTIDSTQGKFQGDSSAGRRRGVLTWLLVYRWRP